MAYAALGTPHEHWLPAIKEAFSKRMEMRHIWAQFLTSNGTATTLEALHMQYDSPAEDTLPGCTERGNGNV